jgi:UPF0755 protein
MLLYGVIALAGIVLGGAIYVYHALKPMPESADVIRIDIPPGTDSAEIAQLLQKNGLIRNATMMTYYLKLTKQGSHFQAGTYEMSPGIKIGEIIEKLNNGQIVKEETMKFTVPEGYTVQQIADKLYQQFGIDPKTFLEMADQSREFTAKSIAEIPDNPAIKHRLEGYFFPETYEWKKNASIKEIIDRMLVELDRKLSELPPDWPETLRSRQLGLHQLLTIASMIEREVALDEERPIVAGIIYNRLRQGMHLQVDATVQYVFEKQKERLYEKDLQVESPYNTYLHAGLPPGPIASPSLASIRAALYPAETKYLFYVTKKDGSKEHLFAETYEEHQKNIAASKK